MTQPSILTPESLAQKTAPIMEAITNIQGQVERAVISNAEALSQAGDLYKIIGAQIKKSEDARKALVTPLNDHVKWINAQFKEKTEPLEAAKTTLKGKMDKFVAEEEERQRKEAEAAKKLAEEEALAKAAAAEEAGDKQLAEDTLKAAADLPDAIPKTEIARGNYGSSTSKRVEWKGEIVDIVEFCKAIAEGKISREQAEEAIEVKQSWLNKLATSRKVEKTNFGIRLYKKVSAGVR